MVEALSASKAYQAVQKAREKIEEHQAAKIMLRDLRTKQQRIAEKLERGEQPTESEMADLERTAEIAGFNPYIRELFQAELVLGEVLTEIQREIARAVGIELPSADQASQAETHEEKNNEPSPPKTRLWTPGS